MVADKSWNQRFNLLRFFDSELFPSVQGYRVQEQMECLQNKLRLQELRKHHLS